MYFKREELKDVMIVDSAGYLVGYVDDIVYEKDRILLAAYTSETSASNAPDMESLKSKLLSTVKKRFGFGRASIQDLESKVRSELGVQAITDKVLLEYARQVGVEAPMKSSTEIVKAKVANIPWDEIEAVGKTEYGTCILLKTARKAQQLGVPIGPPNYLLLPSIKGKNIVSDTGHITGKVGDILYSVKNLGISIVRRMDVTRETIDVQALKLNLATTTFRNADEMSTKIAGFYSVRKEELSDEMIVNWARMRGITIPTRATTETRDVTLPTVLPWEAIKQVGDMVIVKSEAILQIADLREWRTFPSWTTPSETGEVHRGFHG